MNGRVYIPSGMMMLSPDPYIPDPTDTRSYNRYSYANYNPLTYIDPSGFDGNNCPSSGETSGAPTNDSPGIVICGGPFMPPGLEACYYFGACFEGEYCALAPANCPPSPLQLAYGGGSLQTIKVTATRTPCRLGIDCYSPPPAAQVDRLTACLSNVAANFPEDGTSKRDAAGNAATAGGAGAEQAARATEAAIAATNRVGRPLAATQTILDPALYPGVVQAPTVYAWRGAQGLNWAILRGGAVTLGLAGTGVDLYTGLSNVSNGNTRQGVVDLASIVPDVALTASFTATAPVAIPTLIFIKTLPANLKANAVLACVRLANGDVGSPE